MPMTTRLYVIKTKEQNRKNKKKIGEGDRKRVTCDCTRSLLLAVFIAVVLVCIGISMCFIAYHASSSIMGLGSKDMHPGEADKQLSEGDSRIYKLLYNLRIVGPILMGTGGFIILCSIVVAYRDEKEKKEVASELLSRIDPRGSGNVDGNGAPYDIYDLAIRKYLQISDEKTRRRNTPQGTITLPNEKKDLSNKNSAKTSPRTDTDRSTGQLESRKNSMKSLENALIKIGGLVPQGMFIRRGSEVAPSQLQESEDMGRTGSVLIPRSTQQTSQQSTVEVNNYPLRTTVSCTVAIPNVSRNTNNPVQSESSSEDSNKSTPKKNKRPNSSALDTPRTQEQTPNQTSTNKKQSKSEVQKSGNEKSSKSNNQPSRAASGRIPGNRKSVPLLVVNDHIKQTSQNQKKIEELKREDSNGSTGSDTAVIPNGAMCPPSPSPSTNHTGGLNQLPNKAMKLTEVSD